eukprot:SAG11_NODE_1302_length_5254_cov_4.749758_2_plen_62_part_00
MGQAWKLLHVVPDPKHEKLALPKNTEFYWRRSKSIRKRGLKNGCACVLIQNLVVHVPGYMQ